MSGIINYRDLIVTPNKPYFIIDVDSFDIIVVKVDGKEYTLNSEFLKKVFLMLIDLQERDKNE